MSSPRPRQVSPTKANRNMMKTMSNMNDSSNVDKLSRKINDMHDPSVPSCMNNPTTKNNSEDMTSKTTSPQKKIGAVGKPKDNQNTGSS